MSEKDRFDFQRKKSLHINLKTETHAAFRIELFKRGLSMQETLEDFAMLVGVEYAPAMRILDNLVEKKKNKEIEGLSAAEADEIYRMLEEDGPLAQHSGR